MLHNANVILCAENIEVCRQQGIREVINLKFYRLSVILFIGPCIIVIVEE